MNWLECTPILGYDVGENEGIPMRSSVVVGSMRREVKPVPYSLDVLCGRTCVLAR